MSCFETHNAFLCLFKTLNYVGYWHIFLVIARWICFAEMGGGGAAGSVNQQKLSKNILHQPELLSALSRKLWFYENNFKTICMLGSYKGTMPRIFPRIVSLIIFELFQIKCTEGHSPCAWVVLHTKQGDSAPAEHCPTGDWQCWKL